MPASAWKPKCPLAFLLEQLSRHVSREMVQCSLDLWAFAHFEAYEARARGGCYVVVVPPRTKLFVRFCLDLVACLPDWRSEGRAVVKTSRRGNSSCLYMQL